MDENPCLGIKKILYGIPVLIADDGITYMVCNKGFPEACMACDYRFKCYTHAEKWETLQEYQARWRR